MILLGSAYHPPDNIAVYLKNAFSAQVKDVAFVSNRCKILTKPKTKYIIFLGSAVVRKNQDIFNSKPYQGIFGIVCDNVLILNNFEGLVPLDFNEANEIHLDAFELNDINPDAFKTNDRLIAYSNKSYEDKVVDKVQSFKGILTQFMTFIYTTPSATHQKPLKELACSWLTSDSGPDELLKQLKITVKQIKLSEQKQKRFITLLTSDNALLYKKALSEVIAVGNTESKEFLDIINKYGVSAYEVRYILAINKNIST